MKTPRSGFSQEGLGRMFGVMPIVHTESPPKTTHQRTTAIIASSVCVGVLLLGLIALIIYYRNRRHRQKRAHNNPVISEKDPTNRISSKTDLRIPETNPPEELPVPPVVHEMMD